MNRWIICDSTYLCHRAYHSHTGLSYNGEPTGVLFGFLKDIHTLRQTFATERFVFCWDHGKGLREIKFPYYKETRRKKAGEPEYEQKQEILRPQVEKLKKEILFELGYKNVFWQNGYEADDIIASVIHSTIGHEKHGPRNDEFIIVTGDTDLYQLIQPNVSVYHPREGKEWNVNNFPTEFGVDPKEWAAVKAIMGCSTDDVPGIDGVGIKTACRYFWDSNCPKRNEIKKFLKSEQAVHNFMMVRLPYKGVKEFDLRDDKLNAKAYKKLIRRYGMASFKEYATTQEELDRTA